ncbi:MAG: hypothetical protein E3J35_07210 [Methanomassiliicoccales archaeon]|nr:MAG: hypothetical protein E3J35_07210 [Methanomassiliicoccales archaeon]
MTEKATHEEIGTEVGDIFGILNALKISGDVNQFQQWLRTYHGAKRLDDYFEGYKFLLKTIVRTFVTHLVYDSALDIKEDFKFYRMNSQGMEIHSVPNACDKTVLIKNLYESAKPMWKSRSWTQLEKSAETYMNESIAIFDRIFDKRVDVLVDLKTSKADALRYATIFYTMALLTLSESGRRLLSRPFSKQSSSLTQPPAWFRTVRCLP